MIFNSFKNYVLNKHHSEINTNNLRIVKLYSVVHEDRDEAGRKIGMESAKVVSNYVLVEKIGNLFRIIPTRQFQTNKLITDRPTELHELFIKKTSRNNRYKKPVHFCEALSNKTISIEEAESFAQVIAKVNIGFDGEATAQEAQQLKSICEKFNKYLKADKSFENQEQYIK